MRSDTQFQYRTQKGIYGNAMINCFEKFAQLTKCGFIVGGCFVSCSVYSRIKIICWPNVAINVTPLSHSTIANIEVN